MSKVADILKPHVFSVLKSREQERLEKQGCAFRGQELLANHELDPCKPCQCGRPNKGAF